MAAIKTEIPDYVSICKTDDHTQLQYRQNTVEEILCKICQTYFSDWISLEHHMEVCYRRVCGVCGQIFASNHTLTEHIRTHDEPSRDKKDILKQRIKCHRCRFCKMSFKFPTELRNHLMTHTVVKHYLCSFCGNNFSLAYRSKCERTHSQHSHKHINKKTYNNTSDPLNTQPRFGCSICQTSYFSQLSLMNHKCIKTSKNSHKCSQCNKILGSVYSLKRHERTHTGVKPFECSQCSKCFIDIHGLRRHKLTHTIVQPYECSHCNMRFVDQSTLTYHKCVQTAEKPYKCSHCNKRYSTLLQLKRHELTHTAEKPYECSQCSKCFLELSKLNRHKLTHSGEKPHKCSNCGKCFGHKESLKRHERLHNDIYNYVCSHCKKRFTRRDHLVVHELTAHARTN